MDKNKTFIIVIGILFLIIVAAYFGGRRQGINSEKNKTLDKEFKTITIKTKLTEKQIDSIKATVNVLTKEKETLKQKDTEIKKEADKIVIEKPKDEVCNDLYEKSVSKIGLLENRISVKDSIEKKSNNIITNQSIMLSKKDTIISYKDRQIQILKDKKPVTKKFGIGVSFGYGIKVENNRISATPYVGVGINYNIFNF